MRHHASACAIEAWSLSDGSTNRCPIRGVPRVGSLHHEICKYYQSTSKVRVKVLQNLVVPCKGQAGGLRTGTGSACCTTSVQLPCCVCVAGLTGQAADRLQSAHHQLALPPQCCPAATPSLTQSDSTREYFECLTDSHEASAYVQDVCTISESAGQHCSINLNLSSSSWTRMIIAALQLRGVLY